MRTVQSIHAIALLAVSMLLPATIHPQSFDKSYAILIAVNDYQQKAKWQHLDYPEKDARAFGEFLTSQGFIVKPFYGPAARKQAILAYMTDTLAPNLGQNDRILFFFAGHGHTDTLGGKKRGYIVPYDGDSSSSLISMDELEDESSVMGNARHQIFLLDSCFGGLLERPRDSIVDPQRPHYIEEITGRIARQALTAGGENDQVVDNGPNGHSVFMDAMLEALKDGKADLLGNGYITFSELAAYVVPRASNKYQTPAPGYLPGHQLGEFWFRNPRGPSRPAQTISVPASIKLRSDAAGKTPEQYYAAGDARFFAGDYDGAAEQYRMAIQLNPGYTDAHWSLGVALGEKGDWDGTIREEQEALRLNPNDEDAHRELGVALGHKGDWDGDIAEEQEALRLKPNDWFAHHDLGAAFGSKGNWDGCIAEEQEALRLKPDDEIAHLNLGAALGWKGDWDGDLKEEQEALRLKPDDAAAHRNLGAALTAKDDWDGDMREQQEALRLNPNDAQTHNLLGKALEHKGQYAAARDEYAKATSLEPTNGKYKDDLARVQNKHP